MSKQEDVINRAYCNVPKEVGFYSNLDIFPSRRGIRYYWLKLIRKLSR